MLRLGLELKVGLTNEFSIRFLSGLSLKRGTTFSSIFSGLLMLKDVGCTIKRTLQKILKITLIDQESNK